MVGEREIAKPRSRVTSASALRKLDFASEFSNIPDERLYPIEHPRIGFAAARVPSHVSPRRPLS